jgi:ElaA protein
MQTKEQPTVFIKHFAELTPSEVYEILKARCDVFLCGQRICYLDEDNIDYQSTHFFTMRNGEVLSYARLYADDAPGVLRIGRMLSREEGKGNGRYLLRQVIEYARETGAVQLRLHAQMPVVGFYEKCGFVTEGEPFIEAGIEHIEMVNKDGLLE